MSHTRRWRATPQVQQHNTRNKILARLTRADYKRIAPELRSVSLSVKETLYEQNGKIKYVYFIESGVGSLITVLDEGGMVETGTVGNEGMIGLPVFLGMDTAPGRAICQIPGDALRMKADVLVAERQRGGTLATLLLRYTNAMMAMVAQTAACNRAHPVPERMSRWLLMTHDRVGRDDFPLTQEFLAIMLGVRRPSVNLAGASLQNAGMIRYSRGKITIVNRKRLESSSCECYANIKREFARALGD